MADDWARPVVHWEIVALVTEPFDTPNGPTLAAINDPEGNPLVLVQQ
jgi:predicted enzyme related to lactoylglutathione lyase